MTKVGIVGAGLMASQLALLFVRRLEVPVVLTDLDQERADKGVAYVHAEIDKLLAKGRVTQDKANRYKGLVTGVVDKSEAFADADFVIEAVFEEMGVKQQVFAEVEAADASLSARRTEPKGRLRLTAPVMYGRLHLAAVVAEFMAKHPHMEVELLLLDRVVDLVEEGIDVALRIAHLPDSTLVALPVGETRRVVCAAPGYLEAHGTPRSIAELERHHCIRFISPSAGRTTDWRFAKDGEQFAYTPRGSFGVTSLEGAVAAAAAGIGVAQVSDLLAMPELRSGALKPVLLDWIAPGPPLTVVYPSNRYLTAKVKAFSDFIAEVFPAKGLTEQIAALQRR